MCIGSCLGSCCGSCAAGCCGNCCKCCGGEGKSNSRVPYMVVMFFGIVLAIVLRYWGKPLLIDIKVYSTDVCDSEKCLGFGAVYRISFVLFVFFFLHGLFMLARGCAVACHSSWWAFKIVGLIGGLVLCYLIPNDFFDGYAVFARFVSVIFLVLQIIILIDFAYAWSESWMDDKREWVKALAACTVILNIGAITLVGFGFTWFGEKGCARNQFFLAFTLILILVFTIIPALPFCQHGSLLTSAVVSMYCSYLVYSALQSDPSTCNELRDADTVQVVVGILITTISVLYAGWNLSNSKSLFGDGDDEADEEAMADAAAAKSENGGDVAETEALEVARRRNLKFHFVMAAAALYAAMVLTNWGAPTADSSNVNVDLGEETVWVKMASQWLTAALYTWTLIAPYVLPNREF